MGWSNFIKSGSIAANCWSKVKFEVRAGPRFVWSCVGSVVLFSTRTGLVDIETERELLWKELALTESEKRLPY